jgi:hypothetical protein
MSAGRTLGAGCAGVHDKESDCSNVVLEGRNSYLCWLDRAVPNDHDHFIILRDEFVCYKRMVFLSADQGLQWDCSVRPYWPYPGARSTSRKKYRRTRYAFCIREAKPETARPLGKRM